MKQKFFSLLVCMLLPAWVYALGLGNLELKSGLNQPLDARIELLYATVEELQNLSIGLADNDAFQRAGIDRPFILSNLKFEVDSSAEGAAYVLISSREAIREPFLNFLLEANWSRGRLYREYTALLDPPFYDPNARRSEAVDTIVDTDYEDYSAEGYDAGAEAGELDEGTPFITPVAGDYGPTIADDTLWSVARQMRPDPSVSIQQMMLALLRANPDAFLDNNINGLKRGQILRMPAADDIYRYNQSEALAETKLQYDLWADARGFIASTTMARAESSAISDSYSDIDDGSGSTFAEAGNSAKLRLVAAADGGAASGQFDGDSTGSGEDLALINEQLEALSQENAELRDRMAESDAIIDDLKRLISLKDDEMAAMQQQLSGAMEAEDIELAEDFETEEAAVEEPVDEQASEDETAPAQAEAGGFDEEPVTTEEAPPPPAVEEVPVVEEEAAAEKAATKQETVTVAEEEPLPAGILDQAIAFVMTNMIMIAAALGGLLLIVGLAVFLVKRKRNAADKVVLPVVGTEFSDFNDAEDPFADGTEPGAVSAAEDGDTAGQAESEPEKDPMEEVNVFLAYEHFDQAEEFVRAAIKKEPDNAEFHAKLLEVFYAAGNKQAYEEEARALNALVGLEGPLWEMTQAMWSELSPNRALFDEPVAGEDDEVVNTGGGIVDLTADEGGAAPVDDGGLDFDLDMSGAEEPAPAPASAESDDILDVTAAIGGAAPASAEADDILDVTAAIGSSGAEDEALLDVTADVGLDMDFQQAEETPTDSGAEDMLDITGSGAAEEDTLEVTDEAAAEEDDGSLDFDIGGMDEEPEAAAPESLDVGAEDADNVIEFDAALSGASESSGADDGLDLEADLADETGADEISADEGLEVDLSSTDDDGGLDMDIDIPASEGDEIGLDLGSDSGDEGLEIDIGDADDNAFSLDIDADDAGDSDAGAELDLSMDDAEGEAEELVAGDDGLSIDLEIDTDDEAVTSLEVGTEEDDDDDMRTVFVPRSSDENEQSADDEIATKLDLAKAYVELGDQDSAKSILDEVIADGNDAQKQQAQDLLSQA